MPYDFSAMVNETYKRRDLQVFKIDSTFDDAGTAFSDGGAGFTHHVSVTASLGTLSITKEADIDLASAAPDADAGTPPVTSFNQPCGCSTSPRSAAVLLVAGLLLVLRRRFSDRVVAR